MRKIITTIAIAALIGAGAWFVFTPKPDAPAVTFQTLEGETISMDSLKGKAVLVKFWATSCVTCVQQMPDTESYYETYHPQGLEVIAVAMEYDPIEFVRQFTVSRELPFTVATDTDGSVAKGFGDVKLTPIAFIIDREGKILKRYLGNYDKQDMKKTIESALAS
ncbi:MAG: TlpA family protein disulfide reductase [Burkholderiaceae bacterium]|nr:TlpA family protein disulfide reductase [Burkholderiaceae bacterium]MCD8517417.1 TlpA family protein disulfide reductase [Burkholderiaceae bacterium]MCD8536976.1 TlpA family protein disulfide reductase [Burkholderiaceae bacterium]MCD8564969.1 TlpA family protein disulfide reductase [Burkholderiaceae bacterium]